jgi:ABC-type Fe3+-hydroxamate transport system substrate-binding protein
MKKVICALLALMISVPLLLCGCNSANDTTDNSAQESTVTEWLGREVTVLRDCAEVCCHRPRMPSLILLHR